MPAEVIRIRGLVQGVGFRPFIWRLAARFGIAGEVSNDGEGVLIRAVGEELDAFAAAIAAEAPPLARIASIERMPLATPYEPAGFSIVETRGGARNTGVVPDAAMCADCRAEIADPAERRHRYAFANCTHCGPRFSIIDAIPYDRAATRMRAFAMCDRCRAEYDDPADRRFHAQPIACPDCGPRLQFVGPGEGDPLEAAARLLLDGGILALKGIGGFHLACDATNETAVAELRRRKRRPHKPFALMGADLAMLRRYSRPAAAEETLLADPAAPVVLIEGKAAGLAPSTAPGLDMLGWMLPYSPLHVLLCAAVPRPLVMTSGNLSGEPQAVGNDEALETLAGFADAFLLHDRDIARRLDDSVAAVVAGDIRVLRRARGFAPAPLELPLRHPGPEATGANIRKWDVTPETPPGVVRGLAGPLPLSQGTPDSPLGFRGDGKKQPDALSAGGGRTELIRPRLKAGATKGAKTLTDVPPLLAMGGELKSAICFAAGGEALLSHHMGDLEDALSYAEYEKAIADYETLFGQAPEAIVCDAHPEYRSTLKARELAEARGLPLIEVQHHHAHIVSAMAENGWPLDGAAVLGVSLDGTGYGGDGTVWGGEWLLCRYGGFERLASLTPVALPGSAAAVREPWRNLLTQALAAFGEEALRERFERAGLQERFAAKPVDTVQAMIRKRLNTPLTSSAGRLFDAVGAAIGCAFDAVSYEGQSAMEAESLARSAEADRAYGFDVVEAAGIIHLDPAPLWPALFADLERGETPAQIAARFHLGFAQAAAQLALRLARSHDAGAIALSGGVMQNGLLMRLMLAELDGGGLPVLTQRQVPSNDGGLAFGQAAAGAARLLGW
jgi:hydrogenase maturation protein HypF